MNRRLYACVMLLAIAVCLSSGIKNDRVFSHPSVIISDSIKKYHNDIYQLIEDSIIGGKSPYHLGVYDYLSDTKDHMLYITMQEMSIKIGGYTKPRQDKVKKMFFDTIFLNSEFLQRGCKEYIVQVIVHESIHAFIYWTLYSFHNHKNNVDSAFLQEHFPENWQWISKKPKKLKGKKEHRLMYQNYFETMRKCILAYTKPAAEDSIQKHIARSLAWGGLEKTPEWRKQSDKCLFKCIDIISRNINPPNGKRDFDTPPCSKESFRSYLEQVRDAFQTTNSARRLK